MLPATSNRLSADAVAGLGCPDALHDLRERHPLPRSGYEASGCLVQRLSGMNESIKDSGGGRGGLCRACLVPGGDVASAERGQCADCHRALPECHLRDDGRTAPGGD